VQGFKDDAVSGGLETPDFKRRLEEFDKYSKEFSGKKKGARGGPFEYVTYHGDIVQKLFDDRTSRLRKGERVFNSALIDLFVKKDGRLSEVYEVKTGLGLPFSPRLHPFPPFIGRPAESILLTGNDRG
jgi:hypothetical protein